MSDSFVGTPFLALLDDEDDDLFDDSFEDDVSEYDEIPYEPDDDYNPYEQDDLLDDPFFDDIEDEDDEPF